ncbi:MAG: hypothetical protein LBT50_04955 [Prevotellaceae bacterium]|jgi:hypothetical protein|nr:hypothetical protein [Prevotellaceae bacterium]
MNRIKSILTLWLAILIIGSVQAQTNEKQATTSSNLSPFLIELGLKGSFFKEPDNTRSYFGGSLGFGLRATRHCYATLGFDFSGSKKEPFDDFEYTKTITYPGGKTEVSEHDDGVISLKYLQRTLLFGWRWEILLKNKCAFTVGPYAGFEWIKPKFDFDPIIDNDDDYVDPPKSVSMGVLGAGIGFRVRMVKLEYRFLMHTSPTVYEVKWNSPNTHEIVLSLHLHKGY